MTTTDDTDSLKDLLISDNMARRALRPRSLVYYFRYKAIRYLSLFIGSCCISFTIFLLVFCTSSTDFLDYLFSDSENNLGQGDQSPELAQRNYMSKSFLGKEQSIKLDQRITYQDFDYLKPETLTYKNQTFSNNIPILFRLPTKVKTWGLLLIFHGCSRWAHDWFHTVERQRIVGAAINLGFGCLAFQSTDKVSRCWSTESDIYANDDVQMVLKGLEGFYKEYPELESLPRFTFGASSGGMFSSLFVINQRYPIQGQILFISIVHPQILLTHVKVNTYPATIWIHMLRDIDFASEERINMSMRTFAEQKVPHKRFSIEPIRLQPSTFSDRIPTLTSDASHYIFYKLQRNQWLNNNNFLMYNPRRNFAWESFLFGSTVANNNHLYPTVNLINQHREILSDFLNTVYGEHEISFERSYEALTWFKENVHIISNKSQNVIAAR